MEKEFDNEIALFKAQLELVSRSSKKGIIEKLQWFFLDLKQGFAFSASNQRINLPSRSIYVDLVFYNRNLINTVLVNFRKGNIQQQDVDKMNLAVGFYNNQRLEEENETVGIIIGQLKNEVVVEYIYTKNEDKKSVIPYETVLPNKEKLKALLIGK